MKSSKELYKFYEAYARGDFAEFDYEKNYGLCFLLYFKYSTKPNDRYLEDSERLALHLEMQNQFTIMGLNEKHPFNESLEDFYAQGSASQMTENPKRIQWVKDRLEAGVI